VKRTLFKAGVARKFALRKVQPRVKLRSAQIQILKNALIELNFRESVTNNGFDFFVVDIAEIQRIKKRQSFGSEIVRIKVFVFVIGLCHGSAPL
jgi:hypothetical protein